MAAKNTHKSIDCCFFDQALGAWNDALFYKVILDTFFRIFWAIMYIVWGEGLNLSAWK